MIAFEYEPVWWPPCDWLEQPARIGQLEALRRYRDSAMITQRDFKALCVAILEAYGLPIETNRGSAEVLIDFMRYARAKNKRLAYRAAWGELPV